MHRRRSLIRSGMSQLGILDFGFWIEPSRPDASPIRNPQSKIRNRKARLFPPRSGPSMGGRAAAEGLVEARMVPPIGAAAWKDSRMKYRFWMMLGGAVALVGTGAGAQTDLPSPSAEPGRLEAPRPEAP